MMRLSTKGRYGTRLMLDLAIHYDNGLVLLKDIAKRQELSEGYLEHLVPLLKSAGLIISSRGARGGYKLAKTPSEITIKEIVTALEGTLSPSECINTPSICQRADFCITRDVWKELEEKILQTLESMTLKDIVDKYEDKIKNSVTYNI